MDTKTIEKIIEMLDVRIDELQDEFETTDLYGYQLDWLQGQIIGFKDFKEHLRKLWYVEEFE